MKMTDLFLAELEREAAGTRRVLERVPEGRNDWKPHEKSMQLGYLAGLVASMPSWIAMMVNKDEMDITSPEGAKYKPQAFTTSRGLVHLFDQSLTDAREALTKTTDEHLVKPWRFVVGGHVAAEQPRYIMIRDSVLNHLAHHRGQLTVYLRLCGAPVPAIYGPSADEGGF
ncbi:MAG: DinB family protein [Terriglobia bacterium]